MRIEQLVVAAALLFGFGVSSECQAAPRARDDFYVQLTAGLGLSHIAFRLDDPSHATNDYSAAKTGPSVGFSLLLGVPLRPGLVLGAGGIVALSSIGYTRPVESDGQNVIIVDVKASPFKSMGMVGPFVDFYPSPTLG